MLALLAAVVSRAVPGGGEGEPSGPAEEASRERGGPPAAGCAQPVDSRLVAVACKAAPASFFVFLHTFTVLCSPSRKTNRQAASQLGAADAGARQLTAPAVERSLLLSACRFALKSANFAQKIYDFASKGLRHTNPASTQGVPNE